MHPHPRIFDGPGIVRQTLRDDAASPAPRLAPAELHDIEAVLALMLDSKVPSWICWGPELRMVYNDAYIPLLGHKHPAALGESLWSVWREVKNEFEQIVARAYGGEPAFVEDVKFTVDRSGAAEDVWFTFSLTPVRGRDGRIVGLYATIHETTRQMRARMETDLQGARLRTMFEQAPGFVAILKGADHVFEVVNAAYRQLVGRTALEGLPVREALPEVVGQGFVELLDNVYRSGVPYIAANQGVMLKRSPDAPLEQRYVKFVYQPIVDRSGAVTGIFVEGSDVTAEQEARAEVASKVHELKRAEERLAFQLNFSDQIRHVSQAGIITQTASRMLGEHLQAARVHYANVRGDSSTMDMQSMWVADPSLALVASTRQIRDYGEAIRDSLARGEVVVVGDTALDPRTAASSAAYRLLSVAAFVCVPLVKAGHLVAVLSVHQTVPTDWPLASVELARDIAERTWDALERAQAQANLTTERDDSQRILNRINEGFVTIGPDWQILQINAEGLKLGRRTLDEVVGKNVWEVWPEIIGTELEMRYRRAMALEKPDLFERYSELPDGSSRWIELRLYFVGKGVMAVMFRDVSERRENEARLQQSEARAREAAADADRERRLLSALLEAAPVGIGMADAAGNLFRVNRANRDLWGHALPHSRSVDEYTAWKGWWADGGARHGQPLQPADWALARALRGQDVSHDVVEIETFDTPPERRTITLSAAAVRDSDGAIIGGVVAQTNITALVEAETALRQADARKDEFLAMLAHELRNPLAPISAAAELLTMAASDAVRVQRTGEIIRRQVGHLTALVDDLLDVSRVTRGLVALDRQVVDISDVLASAMEQARPLLEAKRHRVGQEALAAPLAVHGDRKRLVQVLVNILNNAAKYTPDQGDIAIGIGVRGDTVELTVRDTGIGMSADTVAHVFDLFAQAERSADRAQGGLGIGLALVKRLVELHGGSVHASSAGLGKGSEFRVCLPLAGTRPVHAAGAAEEQPASQAAAPMAIMVVDDNADAADMLAACLSADGHAVTVASSAQAALAASAGRPPQVYLLDIGLPDVDGFELARRLRALSATSGATLIAVTGYGQDSDIAASRAAGFDDHLVKPVSPERLRELLAAAAARAFAHTKTPA
jgi:PAS domain S-box-containing protein